MAGPWTPASEPPLLGSPGSVVTLVEGSSFAICGRSGDFDPARPQGLFYLDTRFLSLLKLTINGRHPEPLSVLPLEPFAASFVYRLRARPLTADGSVALLRHRYVGRGMREDFALHNYGLEPVSLHLELAVGADFADLFEVKAGAARTLGAHRLEFEGDTFSFSYRHEDVERGCRVRFSERPLSGPQLARWDVVLGADEAWTLGMEVCPVVNGLLVEPRHRLSQPVDEAVPKQRLVLWRTRMPRVETDYLPLAHAVAQGAEDLGVLRIFDPERAGRAVIAAGAPWFMTLFGRDSLITSWMALLVDPELPLDVLCTLAEFQGQKEDGATEEQPGRILHEVRFDAAASLALGGGRAYYGTVDATPLFVMLIGEVARWGTAADAISRLLPAADRAISWIERFGDRDGDGYVEYERANDRGLLHQGWKDSWDAVRFADGEFAQPPIALCEVQGYVYAAYRARAQLAAARNEPELAADLSERADALKRRFNTDFWLPDHGYYALALDRDKRPVDALASNMGHCLWTGIVDDDKAPQVAAHLLSPQMFTGWGVRTLATSMRAYDPMSYHNGSVWPHDSAILVAGLMRYGLVEHAQRVAVALLEAAEHSGGRLPELFCGFPRSEIAAPIPYPTSCSPQAWAAASPLLLIRALLGFDPNAPEKRLRLAASLPDQVRSIGVAGIPVAGGRVTVRVDRDGARAEGVPSGLEVVSPPSAAPPAPARR